MTAVIDIGLMPRSLRDPFSLSNLVRTHFVVLNHTLLIKDI